jgi:asparagine synthase (glutamine-hydrolysing)
MCGITAIVRWNGCVFREELERLTRLVSHRGPDGVCCRVFAERIGLGHARLAIQDVSARADQPMRSADGRYVIIYNGEIYNFPEVRRRLQEHGVLFATTSDTEVLLQAWIRWGSECLHTLNGMWAFLIWDLVSGEGFVARDRFGVKPVYYSRQADQLTICSEIDALGTFTGLRRAENPSYLESIIAGDTRVFGTAETHLQGVLSLPPGCLARITVSGEFEVTRWYTLKRRVVPGRFADQVTEFRELLLDACRIRLRSDVPIATCLSGGIDSGSIVSALKLLVEQGSDTGAFSHRSFTAAFPGTPLDETRLTSLLARRSQVRLDEYVMECPSPEQLETALGFCDGPMPAMAFYPIWKLYQHIRQSGITVTLDGQGADEMLGGYYIGPEALISGWQSRNPLRLWDLWGTYRALHSDGSKWMVTARGALERYARGEIDQTLKRPFKTAAALLGLYQPRPDRMPVPVAQPDAIEPADPDAGDWLAHKLWDQFFSNPLPFLLHQYDRCSMASGVECRMPFMDYRLVEYVFSLPLESRIGRGFTKRILRAAMRGIMPAEILDNRIKTGFNAPFADWMKGKLREWTMDLSGSESFLANPHFDGRALRESLEGPSDMQKRHLDERLLWPALHLTWWKNRSSRRFDLGANA